MDEPKVVQPARPGGGGSTGSQREAINGVLRRLQFDIEHVASSEEERRRRRAVMRVFRTAVWAILEKPCAAQLEAELRSELFVRR